MGVDYPTKAEIRQQYQAFKTQRLKNPEVRGEYEALESEFEQRRVRITGEKVLGEINYTYCNCGHPLKLENVDDGLAGYCEACGHLILVQDGTWHYIDEKRNKEK